MALQYTKRLNRNQVSRDRQPPLPIEHMCTRLLCIGIACCAGRLRANSRVMRERGCKRANRMQEKARDAIVTQCGGEGGFVNDEAIWLTVREKDWYTHANQSRA